MNTLQLGITGTLFLIAGGIVVFNREKSTWLLLFGGFLLGLAANFLLDGVLKIINW